MFFGDEGNNSPTLDGYATVDLHTSYDVTDHIQVYGLVDNVFDSRYGLFGNYFNLELANNAGAAGGLPDDFFTDLSDDHARPADHGLRRCEGEVLIRASAELAKHFSDA